eukprot:6206288-Pleurochrysis_carterae.AAC.1
MGGNGAMSRQKALRVGFTTCRAKDRLAQHGIMNEAIGSLRSKVSRARVASTARVAHPRKETERFVAFPKQKLFV